MARDYKRENRVTKSKPKNIAKRVACVVVRALSCFVVISREFF